MAGILRDLTGRTIERVVIDDDDWKAAAIERGMPAPAADFSLGMFRAARAGEFAVTDPLLETVIGHQPTSARAFLETIVSGH